MELAWVRQLYVYHWWANRKLWDTTTALGDAAAAPCLTPWRRDAPALRA